MIEEGDDGDDFFIVESGTFNIFKRESEIKDDKSLGTMISTLKEKGSFGELALLFVIVCSHEKKIHQMSFSLVRSCVVLMFVCWENGLIEQKKLSYDY